MNQGDEVGTSAGVRGTDAEIGAARAKMFTDFCELLESQGIDYAILAGYQTYPARIDSDVDFMVSEIDFGRLRALFSRPNAIPDARLIQALEHETTACYFIFARQIGARMAYLHADAAASYRRGGRLWLDSRRVLSTRIRHDSGFWVPAPDVEFEYYFVKRVDKGVVEGRHLSRLRALMQHARPECMATVERLMGPQQTPTILRAITGLDTVWFAEHSKFLRRILTRRPGAESAIGRFRSRFLDVRRQWRRVRHPTGLVIAVLGPDGSGKTTLIEHMERELASAFRRVRRFHLRPHFGRPATAAGVKPQSQPPRHVLLCWAKVFFFLADYWIGWLRLVLPARIQSTLVIFDRYYHDLMIDPGRYRLPPAFAAARWCAPLVPLPDFWLVLTAPSQLLVARKGEVTLEAAERLAKDYRQFIAGVKHAELIDTARPLMATLVDVLTAIGLYLQQRISSETEASK